MQSLATTLSGAFGIAPGQALPATADVEIDRFDRWHLTPSSVSGHMAMVSCGKSNEEADPEDA